MARKKNIISDVAGPSGVKKVKHQPQDNDDTDFQIAPYRARTKNADQPSNQTEIEEVDPGNEQRRVSPKLLVDSLQKMNPCQIKAVGDLGFGNIFHLRVSAVPGKLISWCLENFKPMSCSLELPNKSMLHIASEDAYLIFGFPRGALKIDKHTRTKDTKIVEEWSERFGKSKYRVLPSDIVNAMLEEVDGGDWFCRLFLMLMESCLFENAADGYVKPKIMDIIRDLSKIRQYDWCDHMISSLLRTHDRWVANKQKQFTGPSVFLVIFYCDRMVHYKRDVVRSFPLINGWTSDALRARQRSEVDNNGFGRGYVDNRLIVTTHFGNMGHDNMLLCLEKDEGIMENTPMDANAYTHTLILTAKKLAESMSSVVNMIMDAPMYIRNSETFSHVVQSTTALIGVNCPTDLAENVSVDGCTQKLYNIDWGTKEWQDSIVKMMEVFEEKQELEQRLGDPSFSLGLTQNNNFDEAVKKQNDQETHIREDIPIPYATSSIGVDLAEGRGNNALQKNEMLDIQPARHESIYAENRNLDHTSHMIDTLEEDSDAIYSVVKCIGVVDEVGPLVELPVNDCYNKVQNANEETIEDIINVLNMDPSILETQDIEGVEFAHMVEEEFCNTEGDKGTIVECLKISSPTNRKGNMVDKGKEKVHASGVDDGIHVKSIAEKHQINPLRHTMAMRSNIVKKKSSAMLSPFYERAVSVTMKLTKEENDVYTWLVSYSDGSENDILFDDDNVITVRSQMKTLQTQTFISAGVINAWASHLNYQERFRSQDSPHRFFFTTFPCAETIVDKPTGWTYNQVKDAFFNRIEAEMEVVHDFKIGSIDMVFFPIWHQLYVYVVVIDMKQRMVVLLDNSTGLDEKLPSTVAKLFCSWLINNNFDIKGRSLMKMPLIRQKLPWRDVDNKVDCGVYAMRHMETYMGQRVKDWKCGLLVNSKKTLQDLRVKYCRILLTSEANHQRKENSIRVDAWLDGFRHANKKLKK